MAEPFVNEPIPIDGLPRLRDDAFVAVDPRYLRVVLGGFGLAAMIILGLGLAWTSQSDAPAMPLLITAGVLAVLGVATVLRVMEVRRLGYQVRNHDLSLRSGVVTLRVESLPFARVQHVSVHRGPIERTLELATLAVSSAGPNLTIPGLANDEAERIKLLITERAGVDDDEVDDDEVDDGAAADSWPAPAFDPPTPPGP